MTESPESLKLAFPFVVCAGIAGILTAVVLAQASELRSIKEQFKEANLSAVKSLGSMDTPVQLSSCSDELGVTRCLLTDVNGKKVEAYFKINNTPQP